jgi:hypothetical protein
MLSPPPPTQGPFPAAADGQAFTKIGSDGNAHDQQVVRLQGEGGQQQTFTAELHVDGQSAALGTLQVAELHKVRPGPGGRLWLMVLSLAAGLVVSYALCRLWLQRMCPTRCP